MLSRHTTFAIFVCLVTSTKGVDRPARYVATMSDGQRIEGNRLRDWHDEKALPLLDSQPLFAPTNPLRWLRDRTQSLREMPAAYVEFTNGDRLPGTVIDYRSGDEEPYDPKPPHLVIHV